MSRWLSPCKVNEIVRVPRDRFKELAADAEPGVLPDGPGRYFHAPRKPEVEGLAKANCDVHDCAGTTSLPATIGMSGGRRSITDAGAPPGGPHDGYKPRKWLPEIEIHTDLVLRWIVVD